VTILKLVFVVLVWTNLRLPVNIAFEVIVFLDIIFRESIFIILNRWMKCHLWLERRIGELSSWVNWMVWLRRQDHWVLRLLFFLLISIFGLLLIRAIVRRNIKFSLLIIWLSQFGILLHLFTNLERRPVDSIRLLVRDEESWVLFLLNDQAKLILVFNQSILIKLVWVNLAYIWDPFIALSVVVGFCWSIIPFLNLVF